MFDPIPADRVVDIGSELFPLLVEAKVPFYAQTRFFNCIDIGNVKDFWSVSQSVLAGEVAQISMPGTQIAPGVWAGLNTRIDWNNTTISGPVYIGSGTVIASGSTIIGPTWIGHGSQICSNAKIVRSILFEYAHVAAESQLTDMVVCKEFCVDRHGHMQHILACPASGLRDARDRRKVNRLNESPNDATLSATLAF